MQKLARIAGPACVAGVAAVTFPQLSLWQGLPLLASALALTAYGHWPDLVDGVPWLSIFKKTPMNLRGIGQHVGFYSQWAMSPMKPRKGAPWDVLNAEITRHLISGEIKAWGRVAGGTSDDFGEPLESGARLIEPDFFRTAKFHVELAILPGGDDVDFVMGSRTGKTIMVSSIEFDRYAVEKIWPTRSRKIAQRHRSIFLIAAMQLLNDMDAQSKSMWESFDTE